MRWNWFLKENLRCYGQKRGNKNRRGPSDAHCAQNRHEMCQFTRKVMKTHLSEPHLHRLFQNHVSSFVFTLFNSFYLLFFLTSEFFAFRSKHRSHIEICHLHDGTVTNAKYILFHVQNNVAGFFFFKRGHPNYISFRSNRTWKCN